MFQGQGNELTPEAQQQQVGLILTRLPALLEKLCVKKYVTASAEQDEARQAATERRQAMLLQILQPGARERCKALCLLNVLCYGS